LVPRLVLCLVSVCLAWGAYGVRNEVSAELSPIDLVAVDADPTGNTATSVGPIDDCIEAAVGSPLVIDVVVDEVPEPPTEPFTGMFGFAADLTYDPQVLQPVAVDNEMLLAAASGGWVAYYNDDLPDSDGLLSVAAALIDWPNGPYGPGVLSRITIDILASGESDLVLTSVAVRDEQSQMYPVEAILNARVVAGGSCTLPCADGDADGACDAADNCPAAANPGQENADGDAWGDACDNCPATSTLWAVPPGDADCDGYTTAAETTITTDPNDACGFTAGGNSASETWPPDLVESNLVDVSDVLALKPVFFQSVPPASARYDIVPGGLIDVTDVLSMKPVFFVGCVP
jgi:hypothetical protein